MTGLNKDLWKEELQAEIIWLKKAVIAVAEDKCRDNLFVVLLRNNVEPQEYKAISDAIQYVNDKCVPINLTGLEELVKAIFAKHNDIPWTMSTPVLRLVAYAHINTYFVRTQKLFELKLSA